MSIQVRQIKNLKDVRPPLSWEPAAGNEVLAFIDRKNAKDNIPKEALQFVLFEAQQILGRCTNPKGLAQQSTGLVVGYVQSGKTLSFTMLSALAHDNEFGLIVLIAGTKDNLREQTRERLRNDLGLSGTSPAQPWVPVNNPAPGSGEANLMANTLASWADPMVPKRHKKVCLVTVLKNHKRLRALHDCLEPLKILTNIPVLVIDDEADQASPNTFAAANLARGTNRKSTTYSEIVELKKALPHHSYVQYTATPQANLLMALQDRLSPEFAESVSPGTGYIGGKRLFTGGGNFVHTIPAPESVATMSSHPNGPPTLDRALAVYLLGAAALEVAEVMATRTMMVHPAQQTQPHKDYLVWLTERLNAWRTMAGEPQMAQSLDAIFRPAYAELQKTVSDLAEYDRLMSKLPFVLRVVQLRDVNSTPSGKAPVDWTACAYWILVGGAKLDRGFTVEGLTVTYMPRGLGDGSADSIQQRARFCGYKQNYLGYCRIYLEGSVRRAFEEYVEHEQEIHHALAKTRGQPLKNWVRAFVLDASMHPTRRNVIGIPIKELTTDSWLHPKAAHRDAASNKSIIQEFINYLENHYKGLPAQKIAPERFIDHRNNSPANILYESVSIGDALDGFIKRLVLSDADDVFVRAGAVLLLSKCLLDAGTKDSLIDVFVMGEGKSQQRSRDAHNDTINQVFQGHTPNINDRSKWTYGGDKNFLSEFRPTLHIRRFTLRPDQNRKLPEVQDAAWFALHIPPSLRKRFLVQDT